MLVELSVIEQRFHAVMEVVSGAPDTEVAGPHDVSRQTALLHANVKVNHGWDRRYGGHARMGPRAPAETR